MVNQTDISDDVPFDEFRHPSYPNDIIVTFLAPDKKVEKIWVTEKERRDDGIIIAKVLNEPYNPLMGIHEGDLVGVFPYEVDEGETIPMALLPWMKN